MQTDKGSEKNEPGSHPAYYPILLKIKNAPVSGGVFKYDSDKN
jgi:hypothetical protein